MKPIHKWNSGYLATLCNKCSVIITTGHTDDLYCKDCRKEMLQDIMKDDEELGLYEKPKQETLEEVFKNTYLGEKISFDSDIGKSFELGYKLAQKQDKNMYSEEIKMLWLKYRAYTNNEDAWSFKEWLLEQLKK
jgi:hypothetical protein